MIKSRRLKCIAVGLVLLTALKCQSQSLWDLANENKGLLKISTLFTAQNVRDHLGTEEGINKAIEWCKKTGVTHGSSADLSFSFSLNLLRSITDLSPLYL